MDVRKTILTCNYIKAIIIFAITIQTVLTKNVHGLNNYIVSKNLSENGNNNFGEVINEMLNHSRKSAQSNHSRNSSKSGIKELHQLANEILDHSRKPSNIDYSGMLSESGNSSDQFKRRIENLHQTVNDIYDKFQVADNNELLNKSLSENCKIIQNILRIRIQNMLSYYTSEYDKLNQCVSSVTDPCKELLKVMSCGFVQIVGGINHVIQLNDTDSKFCEIKIWEGALKNFILIIWNSFDHELYEPTIKDDSEYDIEFDKLQSSISLLFEQLDKVLSPPVNLIVSHIKSGEISKALQEYKLFECVSIDSIVSYSYFLEDENEIKKEDDLKNFEYIIQFIQELNRKDQSIAYKALYKAMELSDELHSMKIKLFENAIGNLIDMHPTRLITLVKCHSHEVKHNESLKDKIDVLKKYNDEVSIIENNDKRTIDYWTKSIINNGSISDVPSEELYNYAQNNFTEMSNILNDVLLNVIENTCCALTTNFDNLLKLIRNLPGKEYQAIGFTTITDQLIKHDLMDSQILKLAYHLKEIKYKNYPLSEEYKQMFELIKKKIPDWVEQIIWNGEHCQIINHKWGDYLFSSPQEFYSRKGNRRHVVLLSTYDAQMQTYSQTTYHWKLEPLNASESFLIKNVFYNEYIFFESKYKDVKGRHIAFQSGEGNLLPESHWKIIPSKDNRIMIYNALQDEYLFGALSVKVLITKNSTGSRSNDLDIEWELKCSVLSDRKNC